MENSNENLKYKNIKNLIKPYCKRVDAVGDLRRHNSKSAARKQIKSIEILAISRYEDVTPLFRGAVEPYRMIEEWAANCGLNFRINTPEYKKFKWEGIWVDLYITSEYSWGLQMAIRTGSDDYTKWLMTNKEKGGALPDNMMIKAGWLWEEGKKLVTLTEQNFFSCIETEWIRPQQRSKGNWRK